MSQLLLWLARRLPPLLLAEPFPLFIVSACVLSGAAALFGLSPPSVQQLLPDPVVALWNADLVFGGALALVGLIRRRWRVEVAGLLPLGTAALVYATAILVIGGHRGVVGAFIIATFGAAAYLQALGVWAAGVIVQQRTEGDGAR